MTGRNAIRSRRWATALCGVAAVAAAFAVAVPSANATAGLSAALVFPTTASAGQTGIPATLSFTNQSSSPDDGSAVTIASMAIVPACGSTTSVGNGNCPSASADPGVFSVGAGTGDPSSACAGVTFTVKITDTSTGRVAFTPSSTIVLAQNATCVIDTTLSVLKMPVHPLSTSGDSATTEQFAFVAGTNTLNHSAAITTSTSTTLSKAASSIVTTATGAITIGGSVADTARLANGSSPTGTITYNLYGPADPTCANAPAFTTTKTVNRGNASYTSATFTPTLSGSYSWVASYGGDANNSAFAEPCGSTGESVTVNRFTPTLSTQASAGVVVGNSISDTATLSGGGMTPTGTITFTAYGPDDPTCADAAAFTSTVNVTTGNGSYPSASFTPATAGMYTWTASYGGDNANAPASDGCGSTNESVTVAKAGPALSTQASATVTVGNAISDTATLSGGLAPSGSITFTAYGPDDPTCAGPAAFTATVSVDSGDGAYPSGPYTPASPGIYQWTASYSGDANNSAVTPSCGDGNESVDVQFVPTLTTLASAGVGLGGAVSDTATLSGGGKTPTGSITFTAYGPADPTCAGSAAFTSTVPVTSGNGAYPSANFSPTAIGTYTWTATYTGDTNNAPATDGCGGTGESVTVTTATPTLTTHASAGVVVGGSIGDTATLAGGYSPTGSITFTVYGPDDASCAGTPAASSTVQVTTGNGAYTSDPFTPTVAGTYSWAASYSGDADNATAADGCGGANESVTVAKATPSILTAAAASGTGTISDSATVSGGDSPGGTVTFQAFGPNDAHCATAAAYSATVPLGGGGHASSGAFAVPHPGSWVWVATYNGDQNNAAVSEACGDAAETVSVAMVVSTSALPAAPVDSAYKQQLAAAGGKKAYHWTVSGGALPAGVKLSGGGVLSGKPVTPGSYQFTVTVTDSSKPALSANRTLTITVTPMTVATSSLPNGLVGKAYKAALTTAGGKPAFHWTVTSGALPPGLKLSAAGKLTGKPTTAGSYAFTVQVTDSAKPTPHTATQALSITIS